MSAADLLSEVSKKIGSVRQRRREDVSALLRDVHFKVTSLHAAQQRFARQLAPDFRLFDFLRTDEYGLSRCLTALLDTRCDRSEGWGYHGQAELYLELFLSALWGEDTPRPAWLNASQLKCVQMEKVLDAQRRLDIYVEFEQGAIGIENKPWAGDQWKQLTDYANWLSRASPEGNFMLVFLSNRDPSEDSISEGARAKLEEDSRYARLDYSQVIDWLQAGAEKTQSLTVRLFIEQLILFVRLSINQELDMDELNEVSKTIVDSDQNIEAAFHVQRALGSAKDVLIKSLHDELQQFANSKQISLVFDLKQLLRGERFAGFSFYLFCGQDKRKALRFEFNEPDLKDFWWGIIAHQEDGVSEATREEIRMIMEAAFFPAEEPDPTSPWWLNGDDPRLMLYQSWSKDPKPWIGIKTGEIRDRIIAIVVKVQEAFSDPQKQKLLM